MFQQYPTHLFIQLLISSLITLWYHHQYWMFVFWSLSNHNKEQYFLPRQSFQILKSVKRANNHHPSPLSTLPSKYLQQMFPCNPVQQLIQVQRWSKKCMLQKMRSICNMAWRIDPHPHSDSLDLFLRNCSIFNYSILKETAGLIC